VKPDGNADLGAGRTGQELRQRDEIGIGLLVKPFAVFDELRPIITEMRDRSAELSKAKAEEDAKYLSQTRMRPWRLQ
jgi:hypothetical protein